MKEGVHVNTGRSYIEANLPITPDVLLPEQFHALLSRAAELSPERRLMLAILEDAIVCWQRKASCGNNGADIANFRIRAALEAEHWIFGEYHNPPCISFAAACEALEIEPDFLRDGLRKWAAAHEPGILPVSVIVNNQRFRGATRATQRMGVA